MLMLGIETSCDETSVAVLRDGHQVLSNLVASQIDLHRVYGGVVPELACRKHVEVLHPLVEEAVKRAGIGLRQLEAVAVTCGPGLVGALVVGVAAAKALAWSLNVPLIGVNHLEGHIYANFLENPELPFPLVCLLVSGGHTAIVRMVGHGQFERLGETRDDAAGEAFDKVARVMGLGYPGGPVIDRLAASGDSTVVPLPRAMLHDKNYEFSFSGLKTAVLNYVRKHPETRREDVCAGFQAAVVDVLVAKTVRVAQELAAQTVILAGGVACNSELRRKLREACRSAHIPLFYPSPLMCTDNAAMIACAGTWRLRSGKVSDLALDVDPGLPF